MIVTIPVRTVSEANRREHWATRASRAARQRGAATMHLREAGRPPQRGRYAVRLTRVAPRALDDDNLRGALKAVRDAVADHLGVGKVRGNQHQRWIDDSGGEVRWEYAQERGAPREYAVRIEIGEAA